MRVIDTFGLRLIASAAITRNSSLLGPLGVAGSRTIEVRSFNSSARRRASALSLLLLMS